MHIQSWDPIWEDVFLNQEWGKYPGESLIQFIARNYYKLNRQNIKILEIGCGPGSNIWYMARENFEVYGIDGSRAAIEIANKRLKHENLKATLRVGDVINLPFEDNLFNGVADVECLYANTKHNTNLILSEIKRVLKPDGLFYSRTFSDEMYTGKMQTKISEFEFTDISDGPLAGKGFVRLSSEKEIKDLYGNYFKIVSIDKLSCTYSNGAINVSEWVVICKK